jgi:hypothetical protein
MSRSHQMARLISSSRRVLQVGAWALLGSMGALCGALCIEACGSASETSGRRVALETEVALAADGSSFTTAAGWNVTLSKAVVSTGAFYYFDGAPPLVQLRSRRGQQLALSALGVADAQAHPGHYQAGQALGQMLEPWSVDLLAGVASLPTGDGVTGVYRSARFSFTAPPTGPAAGELEGHAAVAEGVAERAGVAPIRFRATADLADIERSAAEGHVEGCEFTELEIEGTGLVSVAVNPKIWFDLVDFAELVPTPENTAEDTPLSFPSDSQPKIAFAQGLAQLSAYKFSFSAP